jgi:hypothetical protein
MSAPRAFVARLVPAQPRLQVVDAREQLAREHGSRVADAEVAPQALGTGEDRGGVAREARLAARTRDRREQAEVDEAPHHVGVQARLGGERVDVERVARPWAGAPAHERDGLRRAPRGGHGSAPLPRVES